MARQPLSALLSYALVAFTIELDNEAEHRMPHRTANYGRTEGALQAPWLVSYAMYANCLEPLGDDTITMRELVRRARCRTNFDGMRRWGYVTFTPDTAGKKSKVPGPNTLVHATPAGRMAREIWRKLPPAIEKRWAERFGTEAFARLRDSLRALAMRFEIVLPDCLPILHYGFANHLIAKEPAPAGGDVVDLPLIALLSRALLVFALEFERERPVSLAIAADLLRVLHKDGVALRELPRQSGVSKESLAIGLGFTGKRQLVKVALDPDKSRTKLARLTAKGVEARDAYPPLTKEIEKRWRRRYGAEIIEALRDALEPIAGDGTREKSPLFRGLEPYPDGWRAKRKPPETLPHFPMVLHRGGYPDGS